jgi:glycosyltransferase involved in cell wall biosynthesis
MKFLIDLSESLVPITWSRTVNDDVVNSNCPENVFRIKAGYGHGLRNALHHLAFFVFIIRRLHAIKPKLIYACDLDTLIPSLLWRLNKNCTIIYDQYDPISSRTRNNLLRFLLDIFEYKIANLSNVKITANILRIPKEERRSWIEIKNLFPIKLPITTHKRNSSYILFYGGVLNIDRGLLACAEAVSKETDWEFHVYGQGILSKTLKSRNFLNVFVNEPIPHESLMQLASKSDLFFAMYDPIHSQNKLTASNKLFEAAQLGIPLLTNLGTAIGDVTVESNLGWAIAYNDSQEIRRVLCEVGKISLSTRKSLEDNLATFYQSERQNNQRELDRIKTKVKALMGGDT